MEAPKEQKLDKGLSQAYDYVSNVLMKQQRVLTAKDMYSGYSSMGFNPELEEYIFKDYYVQILIDWKDRGILK